MYRPPQVWDCREAMKLLTHNMLQSPGTRRGYPLAIEVEKVETVETDRFASFYA